MNRTNRPREKLTVYSWVPAYQAWKHQVIQIWGAKREVTYGEWFVREVNKGMAAADRSRIVELFMTHPSLTNRLEAITRTAEIPVSRASAFLIEEGLKSH
jgi:hypothetical protein